MFTFFLFKQRGKNLHIFEPHFCQAVYIIFNLSGSLRLKPVDIMKEVYVLRTKKTIFIDLVCNLNYYFVIFFIICFYLSTPSLSQAICPGQISKHSWGPNLVGRRQMGQHTRGGGGYYPGGSDIPEVYSETLLMK